MSEGGKTQRDFNLELKKMMKTCNIPVKLLNNPLLQKFLQNCINGEYSDVTVPTESTVRKKYLPLACDNIKTKIFSELSGKYVWISLHETTLAPGRILTNVVVGGLDENSSMRAHLIACEVLENKNVETVAHLVHTSLGDLWGDNYTLNLDKLLLFITDEASYMKRVGEMLKQRYFNMLHMICLVHGLNKVAEMIGTLYPNVNNLIFSVKQIFQKAPHRVNLFRKMLPTIQLPPEPILMQWRTWLEAAMYYYNNFDDIKSVVLQLDASNTAEVSNAQQAFSDPKIQEDLAYIHTHFSKFPLAIQQLQKSTSNTIIDAMKVMFDLRHYISQISGGAGEDVKNTFEIVLNSNPGFVTMCCVVDLFTGKEVDFSLPLLNEPTLKHFAYFKYAPLTLVDVERTFFDFKWISSEGRRNLSVEHLEAILIIHSYNSHNTD